MGQGTTPTQPSTIVADFLSVPINALDDCSFEGKACNVAAGIQASYNAVKDDIVVQLQKFKCKNVAVTGHSLGAGLAVLAMFDLHKKHFVMQTSYTFGQPVIGDSAFHGAFRAALGSTNIFRVTHGADIVVHLGPCTDDGLALQHQGIEVFYPSDVDSGYQICNESHDLSGCSTSFYKNRTGFDFAKDFKQGTCWTQLASQVVKQTTKHQFVTDDHLIYLGQTTEESTYCCKIGTSC